MSNTKKIFKLQNFIVRNKFLDKSLTIHRLKVVFFVSHKYRFLSFSLASCGQHKNLHEDYINQKAQL